jgi:hypothetical protein
MNTRDLDIIAAGPADDAVLIKHYLAIWDSYGTPPDDYAPDAADAVGRFIEESRATEAMVDFLPSSREISRGRPWPACFARHIRR